jgi:hypothetical protein
MSPILHRNRESKILVRSLRLFMFILKLAFDRPVGSGDPARKNKFRGHFGLARGVSVDFMGGDN